MLNGYASDSSHQILPSRGTPKGRILVIDDDAEMRALLSDYLQAAGYEVYTEELASKALQKFQPGIKEIAVDLVITDLNMPEMTGLQFIERFKQLRPDTPIVLITAFGSIETAIDSIKKGAFDYITKPFKLSEMTVTLDRALHVSHLKQENTILRQEIKSQSAFSGIIGKSQPMKEMFDLIDRVAQATANVLIVGESGTGKEKVARAIHEKGPRRHKPFIAINCTAIPDSLLESELFGHAKGSFTGAIQRKKGLFEEAHGGTLFLDEIGDMDLALQAKLLRVIQERKIRAVGDNQDREVDVRIIAATHKDLKTAIRNASFREDLYYRLSVIPIIIPPLRHRREDIPLLADHFLKKFSAANRSPVKSFSISAMSKLVAMDWEGNVRELENVIERVVVLAKTETVELEDLPRTEQKTVEDFYGESIGAMPSMEELEKRYIKFVLDKTGGKKEKAAQILGFNRRTLYRKEREYGFVPVNSEEPSDIENSGSGALSDPDHD